MSKLLTSEKIPYFLAALFAMVALQFNYIIDGVFNTPILEYEFRNTDIKDDDSLYRKMLVITNISTDKSIKNLRLHLRYRSDDTTILRNPDMDPIPPATIINDDPQYTLDRFLYYQFPMIHPDMSYELRFYTDNKNRNPYIFFDCSHAMKLMKKSPYTWLLRNHIMINLVIMLFFIVLAILYTIKISRS